MTDLFGREVAHANPSAQRASVLGATIRATFGRRGFASSASAVLQSSLVSRLQQRLTTDGSILFSMIWKERATPAGRLICRLAASARSISDNDSGSWPTPNAGPQNDTDSQWQQRRQDVKAKGINGNGFGLTLAMASTLATWPTPTVKTGDQLASDPTPGQTGGDSLGGVAKLSARPTATVDDANQVTRDSGEYQSLTRTARLSLSPRATASARDWKDSPGMATTGTNPDGSERERLDQLPRQAALTGETSNGSPAETGKPGQLNPAFSLWLMGYPTVWARCAARVTRSSLNSRRK